MPPIPAQEVRALWQEPAAQPQEEQPASGAVAIQVSVVVPVSERYDDLETLYHTYAKVLRSRGHSFEFVFVIDGGFEAAAAPLESLVAQGEPLRLVFLSRWVGEATALMIGFKQARGDILVTLAAYFQVVPEGLTLLLTRLEQGYDFVVARRFPRIDSWLNRCQTYCFYLCIRWLTGVTFHDISCGLKAMRRQVAREVQLYGNLHRFFPLLAYQHGFRVTEVDIPQHPADSGVRIYRPGVYMGRLLDLVILNFLYKFTKKPLRFFGLIGAGLAMSGVLLLLLLVIQQVFFEVHLASRPMLVLGVLLIVLGVQTASTGLLGELIVFTHAKRLHDYHIAKILE
jgi:glycosyltransferase involved in cell wall biosynthesis